MDDQAQGHAMTEIGLALAMVFFTMMVMGLVFISAPSLQNTSARYEQIQVISNESLPNSSDMAGEQPPLVIYYDGQFYDTQLKPLSPVVDGVSRLLLAVPPNISLLEASKAQQQISGVSISITLLSPEWVDYLESEL